MRTAITVGRKHGGKAFELIHGPETPIQEQLEAFKDHAREGQVHPEFEHVELWASDGGRTKKRSFDSEAAAKKKAEAQAKREADARKAKADAEAAAKKKAEAEAEAARQKRDAGQKKAEGIVGKTLEKIGIKPATSEKTK